MLLRFTKMHGLGNDFMVIDGLTQVVRLSPEKVRQFSDRRRGVGFDQLLVVEAPTLPMADFRYRIYNADGSEAGQCGNGARCFAKFVHEKKLCCQPTVHVQIEDRIMALTLEKDGQVSVDMGEPDLSPASSSFQVDKGESNAAYSINVPHYGSIDISVLSMGNPHAVLSFDQVDQVDQKASLWESHVISDLGPAMQQHPRFAESCNVGFYEVLSSNAMNLRVYERGAGETLACGSGACAAMAVAKLRQQVDAKVDVHLRGGTMTISWQGPGHSLSMKGPATRVFEGQIRL